MPDLDPQLPKDADANECEHWLRQLVRNFGMGFHPDAPGADYVDADGNPLFDSESAKQFDESIARTFDLLGDDKPYEIGLEEFQRMMGDQAD